MAHKPTVWKTLSACHNSSNVIQSIFSGKLLFLKNGENRETQRKPHMPNIFISQLHSLNGVLLSRGVIILLLRSSTGL